MDPHWRPLYASCPFCQLNFTVLARLEDMPEDTAYFLLKSGLASRLVIKTDCMSRLKGVIPGCVMVSSFLYICTGPKINVCIT